MESDAVYFGRRASEERAAAMKAPHASARKAHLELAERYAQLASAIELSEVRLETAPVSPLRSAV